MPQIFLVVRQDLAGLRKLVNRVCFPEARFFRIFLFACRQDRCPRWGNTTHKKFTCEQAKPAFQTHKIIAVKDTMLAEHHVINCFLSLSKKYWALDHPRKEYLCAERCCADYSKKSNAEHALLIPPLEPFSQETGHLKSFQGGDGFIIKLLQK
jgi:hypothetical protein